MNIATEILQWHQTIDRDLPWKHDASPYNIWLSEIILQQTRVQQGIPYYLKFIKHYPTVVDLAKAELEEILQLWEGLGYYSRARNLHKCAQFIVQNLGGTFPTSYNSLLKLPGVGPYTAAAIASFAYNEDVAVLDGNVFRVLSRIFDINHDILSTQGKKHFTELAQALLPKGKAQYYNQAIMDFGALQCTPKSPDCPSCPVTDICQAWIKNIVHERPVKKKAKQKKLRYFHYIDLHIRFKQNTYIALRKREDDDVWKDLFQPAILIEQKSLEPNALEEKINSIYPGIVALDNSPFRQMKQILSHQIIHAYFYHVEIEIPNQAALNQLKNNCTIVSIEQINKFAVPRIIRKYFDSIIPSSLKQE